MTARFTKHQAAAVAMLCDEAGTFAARHDVDETIKRLTTLSPKSVEGKGQDVYFVKNCTRLMVITNNNWAAQTSDDERRAVVYEVDNMYSPIGRLGVEAGRAAWQKLHADLYERGGIRHLMHRLRNRDISAWSPTDYLKVAAFKIAIAEQTAHSQDSVHSWAESIYHVVDVSADASDSERAKVNQIKNLYAKGGQVWSLPALYNNFYLPYKRLLSGREVSQTDFKRKIRRLFPPDWLPEQAKSERRSDFTRDSGHEGLNHRMQGIFIPAFEYGCAMMRAGGWLAQKKAECVAQGIPYHRKMAAAALEKAREGRLDPDAPSPAPPPAGNAKRSDRKPANRSAFHKLGDMKK